MFAPTTQRVPMHTSSEYNAEIRQKTDENVARCAAGGPKAIKKRLRELDREWDIERVLEANAATITLVGVGLTRFMRRRFWFLPGLVAAFLLQHAVQGWCPPIGLFRRFGFRTQSEIEEERYALKALRGDFQNVAATQGNSGAGRIRQALRAVRGK